MIEMNKQIDITIPRECVYQQFEGKPDPCPRCGGSLQQSPQTYLIATRRGKKTTDSFIASNDMGWFCTRCPTAVMDLEELSDMLQHGLPRWDVGNIAPVPGGRLALGSAGQHVFVAPRTGLRAMDGAQSRGRGSERWKKVQVRYVRQHWP
jgi:hypothetical protein